MSAVQFIGIAAELPTSVQVLLVICLFVLAAYLLTLVAFSERASRRFLQLIRAWRHPYDTRRRSGKQPSSNRE